MINLFSNNNGKQIIVTRNTSPLGEGPKVGDRLLLQGKVTQVHNSEETFTKIEQTQSQKYLDNRCCRAAFPSVSVSSLGKAVCCCATTVGASILCGGTLAGLGYACKGAVGATVGCCFGSSSGGSVTLNGLKKYDGYCECGPPLENEGEVYKMPCFTRNPNEYSKSEPITVQPRSLTDEPWLRI